MQFFIPFFAFLLISSSYAQDESLKLNMATLGIDEVESGEYEITNEKSFMVNDQEFIQVDISPKFKPLGPCLQPHHDVGLNRALLLANAVGTIAAGYGVLKVNPSQDKMRHVLAGYVVGNVTTGTLQLILPKEMINRKFYSFLGGVGASILIGIGKEVRDAQGHGVPSKMDAIATGLGGVGGSVTMSFADVSKVLKKR
jgi:hypothetical protein